MLARWKEWRDWDDLGLGRFGRPFAGLDELRREMDSLLSDFEREGVPARWQAGLWPRLELNDEGKWLLLQAELPGVTEKELDVTVTADTLTVRGTRKDEVPGGYSVHRRERPAVEFARSITLPCRIDAERAEATMKNGVLSLRLPKAAEAQPKQITVKAS
ncbi:MAG TPA: Hsp20/alpha crystallin family protein [Polyangiaceae bacterium]|jgi:HSP20 family protein